VIQTFPTRGEHDQFRDNNGLAFSPNGRYLAAADGKVVRMWDVQTGQEMTVPFKPHTTNLTCIAFTPDGDRLVAGASLYNDFFFPPPTVLVWEVKTGKRVLALTHPRGVQRVAVSPDGKTIASAGTHDSLIRVWDMESKKEKWILRGHTDGLTGLAFAPGSRWLVSGSHDGTIRVWDATTGSMVRTLRGHTLGVTDLAFPSDGRRLVSSGLDGTIRVWEWDRDQEALTLDEPAPAVSLAFHPDGRHLASGNAGFRLWDASAGKVVTSYEDDFTSAVAFSPDGRRLAMWSTALKVWDTASKKKLFGNDPPSLLADFIFGKKETMSEKNVGPVWGLAFSPDGKRVASCGDGVKIWDAITGKKFRSMGGNGPGSSYNLGVAYSPDGKHLAGGMGQVITLWDAATGEIVRTFPKFPDTVWRLSFPRDGRRLLAATGSSARGWELPSGQEVFRFRHTSTRTPTGGERTFTPGTVSFSADGQRLATAPGDGTVKVWDMTTGQQILSLSGPGPRVSCVAFSPDGRWLAAGGLEGTKGILRLWDARPVEENKR
jgi:WD40 repeat protein